MVSSNAFFGQAHGPSAIALALHARTALLVLVLTIVGGHAGPTQAGIVLNVTTSGHGPVTYTPRGPDLRVALGPSRS